MFGEKLEARPVPLVKVAELLKDLKELKHEQKLAFDYARKFSKINLEDVDAFVEEIKNAGIPRLKEKHIVKLIDIMPLTRDEVKAIFAKEEVVLSAEDIKKIIEIVKKFRIEPEKK